MSHKVLAGRCSTEAEINECLDINAPAYSSSSVHSRHGTARYTKTPRPNPLARGLTRGILTRTKDCLRQTALYQWAPKKPPPGAARRSSNAAVVRAAVTTTAGLIALAATAACRPFEDTMRIPGPYPPMGGPITNGGGIIEGGGQHIGGGQGGAQHGFLQSRSLTSACTTLKGSATTQVTNRPVPSTRFAIGLLWHGGRHGGGTQRGAQAGMHIGGAHTGGGHAGGRQTGGGHVITGPHPIGGHTGPPADTGPATITMHPATIARNRRPVVAFSFMTIPPNPRRDVTGAGYNQGCITRHQAFTK